MSEPFLGASPMLQTNDMRGTIAFYTDILGFALRGRHPLKDPTWCSLSNGAAEAMFYADLPTEHAAPVMSGRLYFRVADAAALFDRLKDRVRVLEPLEVYHYGMKEFAIADNNGYALAFGQETDEPPTHVDG